MDLGRAEARTFSRVVLTNSKAAIFIERLGGRDHLEGSIDQEPTERGAGEFTQVRESGDGFGGRLAAHASVADQGGVRLFAEDVEKTLELLSKMFRSEKARTKEFPDLREDHQRLLQAGETQTDQYGLVNVEADRIANSLNTLAEQVTEWVRAQKGG